MNAFDELDKWIDEHAKILSDGTIEFLSFMPNDLRKLINNCLEKESIEFWKFTKRAVIKGDNTEDQEGRLLYDWYKNYHNKPIEQ